MDTNPKRPAAALLVGLLLFVLSGTATPSAHAGSTDGFYAGKVVNAANGNPVQGVVVKVFRINSDTLLGRDRTGPRGRYRIEGLDPVGDEELDVRVNGSDVGYESGWVSCNHTIVQTWGQACSQGQGWQPPLKIQRL